MFHRKYPNKKISESGLRRLYLSNGIRQKQIKAEKRLSNRTISTFEFQKQEILKKLREAKQNGIPVLFCDEIAFTKRSLLMKTWSPRNVYFRLDQSEIYSGFRTAIVAVSPDGGLVHWTAEEKVTCIKNFTPFIQTLSQRMDGRPFCLFLDQLSVHKSAEVMSLYESHRITPIFNIGGCPDYNCIETVFAHCKAKFKRRRLHALVNESEFDLMEEIEKALDIITPELVRRCFSRSYALLINA